MSHPFFDKDYWQASCISYHLMAQQAVTGIGFDATRAADLVQKIGEMMLAIENEIEPKLPERPLNKGELDFWAIPAKPFNKDGSLSANMTKWMEKTGATPYYFGSGFSSRLQALLDSKRYVKVGEEVFPIVGGSQTRVTGRMSLGNQDDLKDWLIRDCGWKPTLWNYKKDQRGKPIRVDGKLVKTSPKMQENGKLCPNLEALQGELVRPIVKWLSLRNRKSVLEGWLENERLAWDGRLGAASSGLAASHRQKHSVVANLPKADETVTLGKEVRELFVAKRDGYVLVGCDAAGIEARVEGHYCYPFEGGSEYAAELIDGDIHLKTMMGVYWDKVSHLYGTDRWHKDDSEIKPWRSKSKNIKYASSYGAQAAKIASMLGVTSGEAEDILARFWSAAKPLSLLKERVEMAWEQNGKKWIKGIDGRKLYSRSKHSLINLLFQSCGAIIMDVSLLFMDKWLGGLTVDKDGYPCYNYKGQYVYRVAYYHDESLWEVPQNLSDEIGKMLEKSIEQAGKYLKLRVPLAGEYKVGNSWASTH